MSRLVTAISFRLPNMSAGASYMDINNPHSSFGEHIMVPDVGEVVHLKRDEDLYDGIAFRVVDREFYYSSQYDGKLLRNWVSCTIEPVESQ